MTTPLASPYRSRATLLRKLQNPSSVIKLALLMYDSNQIRGMKQKLNSSFDSDRKWSSTEKLLGAPSLSWKMTSAQRPQKADIALAPRNVESLWFAKCYGRKKYTSLVLSKIRRGETLLVFCGGWTACAEKALILECWLHLLRKWSDQ